LAAALQARPPPSATQARSQSAGTQCRVPISARLRAAPQSHDRRAHARSEPPRP
jgi:hypothetical protein